MRHLVLFHHAPGRTDDQLDEILSALPETPGLRVSVATEGDVLALGGDRR